jgi:hypothetical protein
MSDRNLDSLKHKYSISAPKGFSGLFRSHTDLTSVGPIHFDYSWVRLSDSGTTTKMLARSGSGFRCVPTPGGDPVDCFVHAGALCLVNPGPGTNEWTISVPRNDTGVRIKLAGGDPLDATHGKKFDLDPLSDEFALDDADCEE